MAVGERAGRGAALGGDADRGGCWEGGLDGVSRPGGRGAERVDRRQAGRAGGGKGSSAAADLVAFGSVAAKPRRAGTKVLPATSTYSPEPHHKLLHPQFLCAVGCEAANLLT